ncbi:MAG TPA: hypothetical protein VM695_10105 [Phycisphaerae bacterium]|nr:hypothetical protein [Phycisphaerae bacterium]
MALSLSHVWIGRNFLPERHGQPCRLVVSSKGKHVVEFADGERVSTVRGTFRRRVPKPEGESHA